MRLSIAGVGTAVPPIPSAKLKRPRSPGRSAVARRTRRRFCLPSTGTQASSPVTWSSPTMRSTTCSTAPPTPDATSCLHGGRRPGPARPCEWRDTSPRPPRWPSERRERRSASPGFKCRRPHTSGHGVVHRVQRTGLRHRAFKQLGLAPTSTDSRRLHGLPRGDQRPAGCAGVRHRIRRPASCSARSSCAACTTSTAGTPIRSSPTRSSPTVRPPWSVSRGSRRRLLSGGGTGSCLFPDSEDAMTWNIGDHGFEMTLSTRVPGLIAALRPWLAAWLAGQGLAAVGSWAIHPGGPRILAAFRKLALSGDARALARGPGRYGNMSSPTVLFILERLPSERPAVRGPGIRTWPGRRSRAIRLARSRARRGSPDRAETSEGLPPSYFPAPSARSLAPDTPPVS